MRVKIVCHCCDGKGKIAEKEYPSRKEIMVVCPECHGDGWIWTEKVVDVREEAQD